MFPPDPAGKKEPVKEHKSRLAERKDSQEDFEPPLPEIAPEVEYLANALFEAGPTSVTAGGPVVLTWSDLTAWMAATGIELHPWELRLLRSLSSDYSSESRKAEKPSYPCPYQPVDYVPDYAGAAKAARMALRELAKL